MEFFATVVTSDIIHWVIYAIGGVLIVAAGPYLLGVRYIPHNRVGIVEKFWSPLGPVEAGCLIALENEAGYQANVLRGGMHFLLWPWQYRIHKVPLTVISQGKIGYIFARDGEPLPPQQTLGRSVPSNNFQDAQAFLLGDASRDMLPGQRGRQRAILREGVYAINLALFIVITEDKLYQLELNRDSVPFGQWHRQLVESNGFDPVVVGATARNRRHDEHDEYVDADVVEPVVDASLVDDNIAVVTIHDGPSLRPGEIIAPPVASDSSDPDYHNNFQDIEGFLSAGGRRGRQYPPLTDGTYFINRWFASVELIPKTVVPIGNVGVIVSYYGKQGHDMSGAGFRHGERVADDERGVQGKTLGPGKYPFNTYAGCVHLVPTTNFVLHWITGRTESHRYDESLKSIDLVTADAYEPQLPLSVVVHLDYQKAPSVIQRFADIKKLITQTLDPLLSAYFRDIAHKKTMLELLHDRDLIQQEARAALKLRFAEFDIELVDVLIGKPNTTDAAHGDIETLLQQLRLRQLSREQIETYQQQSAAAGKLKALKQAQALAEKQTELTDSLVQIEIAENQGGADLARARKNAEQTVVAAEAENRRKLLMAEAEGKSRALVGEGQSKRVSLEGEAEAAVLKKKIASYSDPKLYALSLVTQHLANSHQPLVPERLFVNGGGGGGNETASSSQGLLGTLMSLLVAEKTGIEVGEGKSPVPSADQPSTTETGSAA